MLEQKFPTIVNVQVGTRGRDLSVVHQEYFAFCRAEVAVDPATYSVAMTIDASPQLKGQGCGWTRRLEMTLVALCLRLTLSLRGLSCLTVSHGHWPVPPS